MYTQNPMHIAYKYTDIIYNSAAAPHSVALTTVILYNYRDLRGKGGVPWVQIMENEFEYLADRGGHGGH